MNRVFAWLILAAALWYIDSSANVRLPCVTLIAAPMCGCHGDMRMQRQNRVINDYDD
jgi:hypothetical protein